MVEHPVQLGQQRSAARRRGPGTSMPISRSTASTTPSSLENAESQSCRLASTDDLPVVAHLEELLGAPVHVADDRLCAHDPLAVEHQP